MANRIELELGGKYSAGEMFARAQADAKNFGKVHKDAMGAGKDAVSALAHEFSGPLGSAVGGASNLIGKLASGGIWGALGAVAGTAISMIVDHWNAAKEAAAKFADICRGNVIKSMTEAGDKFGEVSKQIAQAKTNLRNFSTL